jgi:hypothetical protein
VDLLKPLQGCICTALAKRQFPGRAKPICFCKLQSKKELMKARDLWVVPNRVPQNSVGSLWDYVCGRMCLRGKFRGIVFEFSSDTLDDLKVYVWTAVQPVFRFVKAPFSLHPRPAPKSS